MTTDTDDIRERADEMNMDFYEEVDEHTTDGGGCMEFAEALAEARGE